MTDYEENKGGSKTMVVLNTSGINKEEEQRRLLVKGINRDEDPEERRLKQIQEVELAR